MAAGIAAGAFGWALLTALGLGALFEAFPALLRVLGVVGGANLAWLGFKGWRAALTISLRGGIRTTRPRVATGAQWVSHRAGQD